MQWTGAFLIKIYYQRTNNTEYTGGLSVLSVQILRYCKRIDLFLSTFGNGFEWKENSDIG